MINVDISSNFNFINGILMVSECVRYPMCFFCTDPAPWGQSQEEGDGGMQGAADLQEWWRISGDMNNIWAQQNWDTYG